MIRVNLLPEEYRPTERASWPALLVVMSVIIVTGIVGVAWFYFMIEAITRRRIHPVQYLMVGLAQSVFVLLMVAYAEQFGFALAYLVAAGATIGLLTLFGATALKLGRRTGLLTGMLVTVYAVLFLILQSADYALLAGSTLSFVALALTMWLTRNEDWHGPERARGWPFRRPAKKDPPLPAT